MKKLHSRIHLDNSKENTGSLDCLGELPGAGGFCAVSTEWPLCESGNRDNHEAIGNGSEAPKGMAVTNLVKVLLASRYGSLRLYNYVFVPPVTVTPEELSESPHFKGVMNLSFHAMDDEFTPNSRLFYQKSIAYLREL